MLLILFAAAAFKAGKIASNPFQSSQQSGGTMIPPPATLAGKCLFFVFIPHLMTNKEIPGSGDELFVD